VAKGAKRDEDSAYAPHLERPSIVAELMARAARDPRGLSHSLLLGEVVAERPRPVSPTQGSRRRE